MTVWKSGIAGLRSGAVKGVVIHNDASSKNVNVAFYQNMRRTHNAVDGFAHYYVCADGTFKWEAEKYRAWHVANSIGNNGYIGIEVCGSGAPGVDGLSSKEFEELEQRAFALAATILKRYGLKPNASTVRLHSEFSATACPWRSNILHSGAANTKKYFLKQVKALHSGLKSVPSLKLPRPKSIDVDGIFGTASLTLLEYVVGVKRPNGLIGGQYDGNAKYLPAFNNGLIHYTNGGSSDVKKLQAKLKMKKSDRDGYLGKGTIIAWQKKLGVTPDGYLGKNTAKKIQKALNSGKIW